MWGAPGRARRRSRTPSSRTSSATSATGPGSSTSAPGPAGSTCADRWTTTTSSPTTRPTRSLYLGAAGMILALDRLAEADLHAPRRDWTGVARGLHAGYVDAPDEGDPAPSLLIGASGILLTSWLLSADPEAADLLADAVAANIGNETNELLWGSPGTMLAAAAMLERTGDARFADLWRRSATQLLSVRDADGCWTQELYGQTSRYLGAGHGFAGNAHALLQRPDLLEDAGAFAESAARVVVDQAI